MKFNNYIKQKSIGLKTRVTKAEKEKREWMLKLQKLAKRMKIKYIDWNHATKMYHDGVSFKVAAQQLVKMGY